LAGGGEAGERERKWGRGFRVCGQKRRDVGVRGFSEGKGGQREGN